MGDLVGIDGGKKGDKVVKIELEVVECGNCESAMFAWKVDASNPKQQSFPAVCVGICSRYLRMSGLTYSLSSRATIRGI